MIRQLLLATTLLALTAAASPAAAQHRHSAASLDANGNLDALIARHAAANGLPEDLVRRVIRRESGGNPRVVSNGNYGLMQIKLGTARAMGYSGDAAGLLDANTNMTYAVKYLAGAYRAAGGNADRAVHYYAAGYYYAAKNKGPARQKRRQPARRFCVDAAGNVSEPKAAPVRAEAKLREARAEGVSVASSSSLYSGKVDYH